MFRTLCPSQVCIWFRSLNVVLYHCEWIICIEFLLIRLEYFTSHPQQFEAIKVPAYSITKVGDYYYLAPRTHCPSLVPTRESSVDLEQPSTSPPSLVPDSKSTPVCVHMPHPLEERSKTPPPLSFVRQARAVGHRRSISAGYPLGHAPQTNLDGSQIPSLAPSNSGSMASLKEVEREELDVGSGYEASRSCSMSSISGIETEKVGEEGALFWLVLRVLPHMVEIYFQLR